MPGIIVGPFPRASFPELVHEVVPGDAVVFYTDGVSEARGPGRTFYGEHRLKTLLSSLAGRPAATIAARVEESVLSFQGGLASDDLAVLVVRRPPAPAVA